MKKNVGTVDATLRIAGAAIVAVLYFTNTIQGPLALILGILAVIFVLTAAIGFCPLYVPLGINTKKQKV